MFAIDDIKFLGSATAGEGYLVQCINLKSGYIDTGGAPVVGLFVQKASTGVRSILVRGNNATTNQSWGNSTALTSAVSVPMSTATNWLIKLNVAKLGGWRYLYFKSSGVACKHSMTVALSGGSPTPTSLRGAKGFTEFGE